MAHQNTQTQITSQIKQNRVRDIIRETLHTNQFSPTDELLEQLGLNRKRFFMILDNLIEPTFTQAFRLAEWLGVKVDELYNNNNTTPLI